MSSFVCVCMHSCLCLFCKICLSVYDCVSVPLVCGYTTWLWVCFIYSHALSEGCEFWLSSFFFLVVVSCDLITQVFTPNNRKPMSVITVCLQSLPEENKRQAGRKRRREMGTHRGGRIMGIHSIHPFVFSLRKMLRYTYVNSILFGFSRFDIWLFKRNN